MERKLVAKILVPNYSNFICNKDVYKKFYFKNTIIDYRHYRFEYQAIVIHYHHKKHQPICNLMLKYGEEVDKYTFCLHIFMNKILKKNKLYVTFYVGCPNRERNNILNINIKLSFLQNIYQYINNRLMYDSINNLNNVNYVILIKNLVEKYHLNV